MCVIVVLFIYVEKIRYIIYVNNICISFQRVEMHFYKCFEARHNTFTCMSIKFLITFLKIHRTLSIHIGHVFWTVLSFVDKALFISNFNSCRIIMFITLLRFLCLNGLRLIYFLLTLVVEWRMLKVIVEMHVNFFFFF